jgi:hypothetical protein
MLERGCLVAGQGTLPGHSVAEFYVLSSFIILHRN